MRTLIFMTLCAGCWTSWIDEATEDHIVAGGKVQAALTGGPLRSTTALARATAEPMKVEGGSPEMTFSLTAADTVAGTALNDLKEAGSSAQLNIRAGGRNRLEIHLDGGGCLATQGTVSLAVDGNKHLGGSFDADGTVTGGSAPCHMTGTLTEIPTER